MPGSAVSDLAGRVLAGRYLLHGAIGTGASGRVYVADDTRLRRRVAVKVLHAALADDAAFLRRFRAEAQLAASLHHPHIVTVHDWGEDEVAFMVLELLEGGSLRGMLDQGELLTVAQAARVGRDVAAALEYAHARGVLHRDIKPANLLFDEHGIVRVADFGLARALAEASWTEPAGAVFGTARYASPEQARGSQLDARSDLYSLALVLVEAVTGRVPFTADTTLGTLTARTLEPIVAPEALGLLGPVVDRAGTIEPRERYPDASTMRQAIADAADALPPPGPLLLAGMIDRTDPHPTRAVPERAAPLFDQDAVEVLRHDAPPLDATFIIEPDPKPRAKPKRQPVMGERRLVPFVVAIVLLLIVALAAAALAQVRSVKPISVPGFIGLTLRQAKDAAREAGLEVVEAPRRNAPDPPGNVFDQTPQSGDFTTTHSVTLYVSNGPAKVAVPSIMFKRWNAVTKQLLDAAGLVYAVNPVQPYDEQHEAGSVISVSPSAGKLVAPDTPVTITLSKGHAPVKVPDVSKLSFAVAQKMLTDAKFIVKRAPKDENNDTIKPGDVIRTVPPNSRSAPYGTQITVYVSKGPVMAVVPYVVGLTLAEATTRLGDRGLAFDAGRHAHSTDIVIAQFPDANTSVPLNATTVVLTLARPAK